MTWVLLALLAQDPDQLRRAVDEALAARKAGDREGTVRGFEKVASLAPNLAASHMNLGAAYFDRHEYAKAISSLERALALNSQLPGAHLLLGQALIEEGRAGEALEHLEAASRVGADNPDVLYFLAKGYALLSQQLARRLLEVAPDSVRADQVRAEAGQASARFAEAEAAYRAALAKQPNLAGIHLALGELFLRVGNPEKAAVEFEAELRTDPDSAQALCRLGAILIDRGEVPAALKMLQRANALRTDMPETLFELGRAEMVVGRLEEADSRFRRVIEIDGDSTLAKSAHYQRAQILRRQGKVAEAAEEIRKFRAKK